MAGKIILAVELVLAFTLLFWWFRKESVVRNAYLRTTKVLNRNKTLLMRLDKILFYSGLYRKVPALTPENCVLLQLLGIGGICLTGAIFHFSLWKIVLMITIFFGVQYVIISIFIARNYTATDDNLLKFLDFLGNYSITSGEITSIFNQISTYLDEPLKSVLEDCYYEAQAFGNTSDALMSMTRKLQHPKFREIVRNIEVTMRYSADFTILVSQSRRSVREYMRMRQERKSLAKEAGINMLILAGMTIVILKTVETLIDVSMKEILLHSWIGKSASAGIVIILLLFYRQVRRIDR